METASTPPRAASSASTWALSVGDLRLGQFAGELTHDQALELDPDIERVARFLPARRRHHGDAVAAQFDQAFGGELPQRVPRDGAADAEAFAERILRQFGAGLQRLLDDGAAQRAADDADLVCGLRSWRPRAAPWAILKAVRLYYAQFLITFARDLSASIACTLLRRLPNLNPFCRPRSAEIASGKSPRNRWHPACMHFAS